jgi:subtilase family serine protease
LAQPPQIYAAQARITTAIDESSLVTLRGNVHPLAQARFENSPASASMPVSRLLLVLTRCTQQEADLQTYLQSVQDKNAPNYHKFLSPGEFGKRFGVGDIYREVHLAHLPSCGVRFPLTAEGDRILSHLT